jgi:hypothetical protein
MIAENGLVWLNHIVIRGRTKTGVKDKLRTRRFRWVAG